MTSRPWVWPVLTAILAMVAAALAVHPFDIAVGRIAAGDLPPGYMGVAVGAFAATALLAAAGYRGSRDPRQLYLSLGTGVMASQLLVFGVVWPLYGHTNALLGDSSGAADPLYAITLGWLIAGVCFLLQWPWRDRRGRSPARAAIACVIVIALVVVGDLVILLRHPSITFATANRGAVVRLGTDLRILGLIALSVVAASGLRAWRVGGLIDEVTGSALILGSLSVVGLLLTDAFPLSSRWWEAMTGWTWLLPMTSGALLFLALVLHGRSESTRMRRVTDRAGAVLDGRAEIASMIAHEVRGPAATVRGIATTSLTHYDRLSDDERKEFLGMIEQESLRLMTTVDQMSLALKVDAGSLTYHMSATDLAQIALAAKESAELGEHPVVGFTEPAVTVWADRGRIVEVVRQLLNNAATFSPPESPIQLVVRREGAYAEVEVIDQGPGIPPEQREVVFTRFPNWRPPGYQEMPGTGLGLFICRGIVAEHSGEISIEGGPEGGTILRMRLPVWNEEAGPDDSQGL